MSETSSPQISVIIPSYNYARYLPDAIDSVLSQNVEKGVEVVVVDDGSTDDTAQVAQAYGTSIRYIRQENRGLSAARNTGIDAASGEFMVFLDADDLLVSGNLNSHLEKFASTPNLDISVCHSLMVTEENCQSYIWPLKSRHLDLHLCDSNISPVHTFMARTKAIREIGYFGSSFAACEDYDFWLRGAAAGKTFAANADGYVIYRQHGGSMTTQETRQLTFDSVVHFKIGKFLEECPSFPLAGKFYGWLTYASGCVTSACGMANINPQYARKLLEESAKAVLKAAALVPKVPESDPYLINLERYYVTQYLYTSMDFDPSISKMFGRALAFLTKRYRNLTTLDPKAMRGKMRNMFSRMICKPPNISGASIRLRCGKSPLANGVNG